jgi:hypothetical protein
VHLSARHLRKFGDVALIASALLLGFYAAADAELAPRRPLAGVAVIYAPWVSAEAALDRAVAGGARFVRYGSLPFIVVVVPDAPEYLAHVLADGAWMVADPQALGGCLTDDASLTQ